MADIIQAAKWLQDGKKVRIRDLYADHEYLFLTNVAVFHHGFPNKDSTIVFSPHINNYFSNDWEIYPEPASDMEKAWSTLLSENVLVGEHDFVHRKIFEASWNAAQKHFTNKQSE